jgi:monovalent cation:H+ antiporter, CPA1 family
MSARTRLSMYDTWELIAYFANSLIFILIGLQVHTASLTRADIPLMLAAVVGILVSRAIVVYGVGLYTNWRNPPADRLPLRFQHVILWGGLRGAIALAAALSIPADAVPERPTIILLTFGIVVFTLLAQGLTIRPLVARLGLSGTDNSAHLLAFERLQGQLVATQAARRALNTLSEGGEIAPDIYAQLSHTYEERGDRLRDELAGLNVSAEAIRAEQMIVARRKALQAEKDALLTLRNRGTITNSVYRALNADINQLLLRLEEEPDVQPEEEHFKDPPGPHPDGAR